MPPRTQTTLPPAALPLFADGRLTLLENEPLALYCSMGVGGPARWLITAESADPLPPLIDALNAAAIPWLMLGGGSNTIFADAGFPGAVLRLGKAFRKIETGPEPTLLTVGAGVVLSAAMNASKRAGLAGMEWAAGVPGNVGGALAGNAGTATGDACAAVERIEVIDHSQSPGRPRVLSRADFTYGYRKSDLRNYIILGATYRLMEDAPDAIQRRIDAGLAKRREQPLGQRCAGCMFKNPPGDAAGRLIDAAGLKGLQIGGARVSREHANFIVNDGAATAADIMLLAEEVRRRVRERFGVDLHLEIRMVGLDSPPQFA